MVLCTQSMVAFITNREPSASSLASPCTLISEHSPILYAKTVSRLDSFLSCTGEMMVGPQKVHFMVSRTSHKASPQCSDRLSWVCWQDTPRSSLLKQSGRIPLMCSCCKSVLLRLNFATLTYSSSCCCHVAEESPPRILYKVISNNNLPGQFGATANKLCGTGQP